MPPSEERIADGEGWAMEPGDTFLFDNRSGTRIVDIIVSRFVKGEEEEEEEKILLYSTIVPGDGSMMTAKLEFFRTRTYLRTGFKLGYVRRIE